MPLPHLIRKPNPFVIANRLQRSSYVSVQSALAFYGLIPDVVNTVVSVTAGRPERLDTPLGVYEFRHVKPDLFSDVHCPLKRTASQTCPIDPT